jgi:dTDP-4-amino-4,6-dideoxygalactose transaminase
MARLRKPIREASANSAPFGQRQARAANNMENSDRLSERLVRLPLWLGLDNDLAEVIAKTRAAVS